MSIDIEQERSWAEVNLSALARNFMQMKQLVSKKTKVMAVVKANAYGHGAVPCARALVDAGADYLAVATIEEALELRAADISCPILILGHTAADRAEDLIAHDITATVYTKEQVASLSRIASKIGKRVRMHVKINTGMERIGFAPEEIEEISASCSMPGILAEGIFTHLACADEEDTTGVHTQYRTFSDVLYALEQKGITFSHRHILNSAGILDFPEYQLDMVRAGIALYGYYPSQYVQKEKAALEPVMSVKTRITHLHKVAKDAGISYGWTYHAPKDSMLATVPIGYADGYFRAFSNCAHMLASGEPVPVTGRICMDQCMIDVSSVNTISVGDEIVIIGKQGNAQITADDLAELIGTIPYEILCATGKRLPRLYVADKK